MVLRRAFSDLPDSRAENRRYPLLQLLFVVITVLLCAADGREMVSAMAKTKRLA